MWEVEPTKEAQLSTAFAAHPPGVPRPTLKMQMSPLGKGYEGPGAHDIPGSFEGHPENIGEWPMAGPGEMAGGVKDIAQGNIAKGGHRLISGAGNTMLPMAPFMAAAAPAATAKALAGGVVGGKIAEGGAEVLGATPEQTQLAGDVGNIAGGVGAAEMPWGRVGRAALSGAGGAAERIPIVGPMTRGALRGAVRSWKATAPKELPADPFADVPTEGVQSAAPAPRPSLVDQVRGQNPEKALRSQIDQLLNPHPPIRPGVPLREQISPTAPAPKGELPGGFTAVEKADSPVQAWRYDPQAREMHIQARGTGQVHVYGDVSSEDAAAFANAPSKGRAWQGIKQNPEVAKVINGKRVAIRPTERSGVPERPPLKEQVRGTGGEDLTSLLTKSVEWAKQKRGQ
jgi:hypothetical protein